MWVIAFFSVLLVAVVTYAALAKNQVGKDDFDDDADDKSGAFK
jgi:hypothetical protein